MGILARPIEMMQSLDLPRGFSVCELGDQYVTCETPHYLAEQLYRRMGCGRYDCIDGNGNGTIKADLNRPLPSPIQSYDLVTDFGTGEHVFNQFQVWKTIHNLTRVGGYIAFDRPTQGYETHCFYNVNRCLLEDVAAVNKYQVLFLEQAETKRGKLLRGVFKRVTPHKFYAPQQGRYRKSLKI